VLKCLLAAVSLERNANPVIHLFHLGEVAVAALASSEVPCILTILQRHALAWDVSDCHASEATRLLSTETNATNLVQTGRAVVALCAISCTISLLTVFGVFPCYVSRCFGFS